MFTIETDDLRRETRSRASAHDGEGGRQKSVSAALHNG